MKIHNKKRFIFILTAGIILLAVVLGILAYNGLSLPCLIYKFTGIKCPGCGNTRAALAFLRLDFKAMINYNLLFVLEMLYVVRVYVVCAKNFINNRGFKYHTRSGIIDKGFLVLLILWSVVRNLIPII